MTPPPADSLDAHPAPPPGAGGKGRGWLIASAIVVGVGSAIAYHFYAAHALQSNLDQARAHVPVVRAAVADDARFANVKFREFAGEGGSIAADGFVLLEQDLADLKERVEQTDPPVAVVYAVGVIKLPLTPTTGTAQRHPTASPDTQQSP